MAKLYFYFSAMNAGKTTTLLQSAHNYRERGMRVAILTPKLDFRAGSGTVASRIGLQAEGIAFERGDDLRGVAVSGEGADARQGVAEDIGQHEEGLSGADVGGDDGAATGIDVEERGLASADGFAGGALEEEAVAEEVGDDEGDGAAPDAHDAGEVSPRHGLMGADEIQDDGAIDLSGGTAGGDTEAGGIDASHLSHSQTK